MRDLGPAATCLVVAALMVGWREWADASSTARDRYLRQYRRSGLPIWVRNFLPMAPLWASMLLLAGVGLVLSRQGTILVMVPGCALGLAAFGLSYRSPAPLTPIWLQAAIRDGTATLAHPSLMDWVTFAIVMPLGVVGEFGLLSLLVGGSLT